MSSVEFKNIHNRLAHLQKVNRFAEQESTSILRFIIGFKYKRNGSFFYHFGTPVKILES